MWESAQLEESAQLCVLHNYYIQIYLNLCLVISPSRPPPHHKFIFETHLEGPQTRLLALLQVHI